MAQGALAEAISHLDVRFGARTVTTATAVAERARERRWSPAPAIDRMPNGIVPGSAIALTGEGSTGKVTLAYRSVASAQASGGMALWVDPSRSLDPLAAWRCGVDLTRAIVVRARTLDEVILAAGAGLRSVGFRLVVVDLGPSFAQVGSADQLAPLLANVRGSTSALVIVSDHPPRRISLPVFETAKAA